MSKFLYFALLFLLPWTAAAGQITEYLEYEEISDSTSAFYVQPGVPPFGGPLQGGFESRRVRIMTDDKDTFVCRVKVTVIPIMSDEKEARNALGDVELMCEDSHSGNIGKEILKDYTFVRKYFYKLRKHMRLKISAYFPVYNYKEKYLKRITAYVDYFPYSNRVNEARYKAKRIKMRYGEKYRVQTPKMSERQRERHEKEAREMKRWYSEQRAKEEAWTKKYYKKYYPEYYRKYYSPQ